MKRQNRKKKPRPFEPGDFVTGVDRSYKRSIYKMLSTTEDPLAGLFEFQSLGSDTLDSWLDSKSLKHTYQMYRLYSDFRHASRKEVVEMDRSKALYRLRRILHKLDVTHSRYDTF